VCRATRRDTKTTVRVNRHLGSWDRIPPLFDKSSGVGFHPQRGVGGDILVLCELDALVVVEDVQLGLVQVAALRLPTLAGGADLCAEGPISTIHLSKTLFKLKLN
jgi:hypothetical protein